MLGPTVRPTERGKLHSRQPFGMTQLCKQALFACGQKQRRLRIKSDSRSWEFSAPAEGSAGRGRKTGPHQELRLRPGKGLIPPGPPKGPCCGSNLARVPHVPKAHLGPPMGYPQGQNDSAQRHHPSWPAPRLCSKCPEPTSPFSGLLDVPYPPLSVRMHLGGNPSGGVLCHRQDSGLGDNHWPPDQALLFTGCTIVGKPQFPHLYSGHITTPSHSTEIN